MIHKLYTMIIGVLLYILSVNATAQPRFGTNDTISYLTKTTDFSTIHWYFTIENYTADSLQMRWKYKNLGSPAWTISLQDPSTWHYPISTDSADFILPDSTETVNNKLIIGVDHNEIPGYGLFRFTVFETAYPADSIHLYFDVTVNPGLSVSVKEIKAEIFPNPAADHLFIIYPAEMAEIFDIHGKLCMSVLIPADGLLLLENLPEGVYFLCLKNDDQLVHHQKIMIQ